MNLYRQGILVLLTTILISFNSQAWAIDSVFTRGGAAIRGYDPVAYFTESKPVKGDAKIIYKWKEATWQFANEANRSSFIDNPEKYSPQYGGYCAYAVSQGSTASTDPDAWTIYEGKLYLNYSSSIKKRWSKDKDGYITSANENWPQL